MNKSFEFVESCYVAVGVFHKYSGLEDSSLRVRVDPHL